MMPKSRYSFLILILLSIGCQSNDSAELVNSLAELQVQATSLRQQRFALADSIRFYSNDKEDGTRVEEDPLSVWEKRSELLGQQSRTLADSIRNILRDGTKGMTPHEKRILNQQIQSMVKDLHLNLVR